MEIRPMRIEPITPIKPLNDKKKDNNNQKKKEIKKENNFKETLDKAMNRQYNSIRKRGKQHDEYKVQ